MREQITALLREMKRRGIYAYLVTTDDFHGSEYVGEHFKSREYLSGFTGSAGTLVVTEYVAALWTDGRYFIQAEAELAESGIELMKQGEFGVPSVGEFLAEEMPKGSVLGFDGRCVNAEFVRKLEAALRGKNVTLAPDLDLVGEIRDDRPPLSKQPVFWLSTDFCGNPRWNKLKEIREIMSDKNADYLVLSAPDDIAWTLNLRGGDIEYTPVFLAFMLIWRDKAQLFAEESIFSDEIKEDLREDGVELRPYDEVYSALEALAHLDNAVWIDSRTANFRLRNSLKNAKLISKPSPVELMKARKNYNEIAGEKAAHIKDGVAVTRFMKWLKEAVGNERITELSAAEKLEEFRKADEDYFGQSFAPIMAYAEHGAIVHYSATEETNAVIEPRGLLLSDTGGHYLPRDRKNDDAACGTTDVTRTFVLGELTSEEKRAFTLALAAHLELLGAVFPKGTRGSSLDAIARKPLWDKGLNFNHGTGHGVGFLLNVHEGPQRISYRASNDAPLEAGMITSNEPGLYFEGKFGIRHESLVVCEECKKMGFGNFLKFSPLTCVPFDREGIDTKLLTEKQLKLLNEYHAWVFETLSPLLSEEEREWLAKVTRPLKPREYKRPEYGITLWEEAEDSGRYTASILPEYDKPELVIPEALGDMKIVGISLLAPPNPAVRKIRISKTVEFIQIDTYRFREHYLNIVLEIDEENPYIKSDGKALYTGKGELLTFYAADCESYEVLPGTRVIKDCAFRKNDALRAIKLPEGVEEIRLRAFEQLTELREINIPDTVRFLGKRAFRGCDKLEALHLPRSLEVISEPAFPNSPSFRELTADPQNPLFTAHNGILYTKDRSMLLFAPWGAIGKKFTVPSFVRTIGTYAFSRQYELAEVVLHPGVSAIERSAFEDCCKLTTINLENVRYIEDRAFYGCSGLSLERLNCEELGSEVFWECEWLTSITLNGLKTTGKDPFNRNLSVLALYDDADFSVISGMFDKFCPTYITVLRRETGEIYYKLLIDISPRISHYFSEKGFDFESYDSSVEDLDYGNPRFSSTVAITAHLRLKYPIGLSEHARAFYLGYLTENADHIIAQAAEDNRPELLPEYFELGIVNERNAAELIALSTEFQNPEFTAYFLELKNRRFPERIDDEFKLDE